jgi:hypothetical protein
VPAHRTHDQLRWLLVAGIVTLLLAGCRTLTSQGPQSCSIDPDERPVEVVTHPDIAEASEDESNVGLDVTSTMEEPVRVTVRFGDARALEIEVPGTSSDCSHEPVYRYAYRLPLGPITVTATTDRGQRDTTTLNLAAGKRWLVVQMQDGFPLQLSRWSSEPAWG